MPLLDVLVHKMVGEWVLQIAPLYLSYISYILLIFVYYLVNKLLFISFFKEYFPSLMNVLKVLREAGTFSIPIGLPFFVFKWSTIVTRN